MSQQLKMLARIAENLPKEEDGLTTRVMQGWIGDPKALKDALKKVLCYSSPSEFLRPLSFGREIIIPTCDATQIITGTDDVFATTTRFNFNWGLVEVTPTTPTQVYELKKNGRFDQIFPSVLPATDSDLKKLCLKEKQIIKFCRFHRDWLHKEYGTFFLLERDDDFFVVHVFMDPGGCLYFLPNQLSEESTWCGERRHRFVIPQSFDV